MTQIAATYSPAKVLSALLVVLALAFQTAGPAQASAGFRKWVKEFEGVAARNGIKRSTYRRAFEGVREADPEVLELARYQPEFKQKVWQYFDSRVNEEAVAMGQAPTLQGRPPAPLQTPAGMSSV